LTKKKIKNVKMEKKKEETLDRSQQRWRAGEVDKGRQRAGEATMVEGNSDSDD
jgi:hypothetical protein